KPLKNRSATCAPSFPPRLWMLPSFDQLFCDGSAVLKVRKASRTKEPTVPSAMPCSSLVSFSFFWSSVLMVSGFLNNFVSTRSGACQDKRPDKRSYITRNRRGEAKEKTGDATEYASGCSIDFKNVDLIRSGPLPAQHFRLLQHQIHRVILFVRRILPFSKRPPHQVPQLGSYAFP